jgi:hypothetical protein
VVVEVIVRAIGVPGARQAAQQATGGAAPG